MTFKPASCKFVQFENTGLVYIWIRRVMRLGQKDLNSLFSEFYDNLIKSIRIQNKIKINKAGEGF